MKYIFITFLIFTGCTIKTEDTYLKLPPLFSDGVILQRDTTVSIWGSSKPYSLIKINTSWGITSKKISDSLGNWRILMETGKAGGPHTIKINSINENIKISDILFGEVWLAAGQSNMEMDFNYCCNTTDNAVNEIKSANFPEIRMFNVKKKLSYNPSKEIGGSWVSAVHEQISNFSAVGYIFAKNLYINLDVPIGIIHSSWGGSRAEAWASSDVVSKVEEYKNALNKLESESIENENLKKYLKNFKSTPMPSGWDLFLGEYTRKLEPSMDYINFFIDDWKAYDPVGLNIIENSLNNTNWVNLKSEKSINESLFSETFQGVVLFKNKFSLNSDNRDLILEINPNELFGLWEYDIFINKIKITNSIADIGRANYTFSKIPTKINIDNKFLKKGINQIIIRSIGIPTYGKIELMNSYSNKKIKLENWDMTVIGEEFFQIDNYSYPYMSLYNYEGRDVDFSKRPKKTYLTHRTVTSLYNGMLNPIIPFTIKGLIWYQGESNVEIGGPNFKSFKKLMPLMIEDWRKKWGSNFPFYFAQIAPYFNYQGMLPYFQNIQKKLAKAIPNSEMVVLNDIGEYYDIHPSNKHDVGFRFSQLALKNNYGFNVTVSGPIFSHVKNADNKINIFFTSDNLKLKIISNSTSGFEIAGSDKKFHNATVKIIDNYIEAFSDSVYNPVYVRYAWSDTASATLFNEDGWPASLFSNE